MSISVFILAYLDSLKKKSDRHNSPLFSHQAPAEGPGLWLIYQVPGNGSVSCGYGDGSPMTAPLEGVVEQAVIHESSELSVCLLQGVGFMRRPGGTHGADWVLFTWGMD